MRARLVGGIITLSAMFALLLLATAWPLEAGDHGGPGRPVPKMTPYPDPSVGGPSTLRP